MSLTSKSMSGVDTVICSLTFVFHIRPAQDLVIG